MLIKRADRFKYSDVTPQALYIDRRRFITYEEMLAVVKTLGYRRD